MVNKFFLYARKSTDTEEKQVLSIDAQLSELRAFASKENLPVAGEFTESMTAKTPGRPIFNQILDRIERGEAQGILSWHPDRLARNSVDGGRIIYLLDCGQLKSLKFGSFWFENTPQGKFMLNLAFGQSKLYSDNLSDNVKRAIREKLRRGEWPGWAPTGYLNDRNVRKVVIDPQKGPLVRRLFETYASGRSSMQQLRILAYEWGLTTRQNSLLAKSMIETMLRNPFYYGHMRINGELYEGIHAPLISKETFDQVQAVLKHRGRPHTQKKHYYPFVGLATCHSCGCSITAERQKGHVYYRCTKKRDACSEPYVREESIAEQARAAIEAVALPDDIYEKIKSALANERADSTQPVASLSEQLSKIQIKLQRLLDAHLEGVLERPEYLAKKEELLTRKLELEERIGQLKQTATGWLESAGNFLSAAHQAGKLAASGDLESQRDFLKKLGSNVRLSRKTLLISHPLPWSILAKSREKNVWLPGTDSNRGPAG